MQQEQHLLLATRIDNYNSSKTITEYKSSLYICRKSSPQIGQKPKITHTEYQRYSWLRNKYLIYHRLREFQIHSFPILKIKNFEIYLELSIH